MQLPDADRFEIAMSILDRTSPAAMDEDEILAEAIRRQDGLQSGAVDTISYEELVRGQDHLYQT